MDHATDSVLFQERVAGKSKPRPPVLRDLLEPPGLDGVVVTADAAAHPGRHHQVPIKTTYTSHRTTDPTNPL
jgi:hypothetical protein